ncbi:MAG: DDE-type integrase/transposase/recombinase [Ruminococcus sp.]|nr:DDE-type integrase/transposase/recombinase [Ruminococcus sp.]
MDYLTVKQVAELKNCSEQYVKKLCKDRKFQTKQELNCKGRMKYLIPITTLPEDLQAKYYKQKQIETGILPEKIEYGNDSATALKYHCKGVKKAFQEFSETERQTIKFWIDLLNKWQAERSRRKDKTKFDEMFVGHVKYMHPDIEISTDILYRKYSAYKSECYGDLIDKRGGWNRGQSKLDDTSIIWQGFLQLYLDQRQPKISHCYRMMNAFIAEEYPELLEEIPSESCFRRKIKTLPFAVTEYARKGEKAFHDHCTPYANRDKSNIDANDIWVMDNYTFDVIIKQESDSRTTKRMYLTTVLDVKSGVLVGWNITDSPDSNSTLDALRFAMLRFGIPKQLYFDNGREFTTLDIAGDKRNRKVAKDKQGNLPVTIIAKLGIEIIFALPTNAQAKVVERIHRIIKEQYCMMQNGYCGGTIAERPENLKQKIKNFDIETEEELRKSFADYADNIFNVAEYGGGEPKYKGMTAIEVWNTSIAETAIRKASEDVLDLLMLRNNGFQKVKRDGVFITYHGKKIWYYDEHLTWQHIGEKVCVRYDRNNPSVVRLYDTEDRYLFSWQCADWLITEYFNASSEEIAEIGRKKTSVIKQVRERVEELQGEKVITHKSGLAYLSKQGKSKFHIQMPEHVVHIMSPEESLPKVVGGEEYPPISVNLRVIAQNAKKQKGEF